MSAPAADVTASLQAARRKSWATLQPTREREQAALKLRATQNVSEDLLMLQRAALMRFQGRSRRASKLARYELALLRRCLKVVGL